MNMNANPRVKFLLAALVMAALGAGCESSSDSSGGGADGAFPPELQGSIIWLDTDVSDWAQTATLNAGVSGSTINMPYDKAHTWPSQRGLNANPWVIVNLGGQWYAATFEYFKFGQTSKPVGVLNGSLGPHIQRAPLNSWRPRSGEQFYLMVSGLARSNARNVRERSNPSLVTWP